MSPLFAALPPADLPTQAYVAPTAVHGAAPVAAGLVASPLGSHTVRPGDTVYDIAALHGVSVEALVRANDLSQGGRWILPGTVLQIPGRSTPAAAPAPAPAPSAPADASAGQAPAEAARTPGAGSITVRAGDTLSHLAVRHGTTVSALASANGITHSRLIHPGQVLTLPASGDAPAATPAAAPSSTPSGGDTGGGPLSRPYDESTIGDRFADQDVPDTFLHYRYGSGTARSAAANRDYLSTVDVPSRDQMRQLIVDTASRHGVDPALMVAVSYQESGWNHRAVSPANAIGAMQVIPTSGEWASSLVGRDLNLLDPQDNVTAGVVIMRALLRSADTTEHAIGGYYQGLASVRQHGLFPDTQQYVKNIQHVARTL